jgi:DNA-binding CsgD family transcriptional regulator
VISVQEEDAGPPALTDEAEYRSHLEKLDALLPTVASQGFDFSAIRGNIRGKTARAIVLHLALRGWSYTRIAEQLGIAPSKVSAYLTDAMLDAAPPDGIEALRTLELRRLDEQARICWEQYCRSCEDAVTETTTTDPEGGETTKRETKPQSGNPAYQRVLNDISKRRAAILGLDVPARVEVDSTRRVLTIKQVIVKTREEALAATQPAQSLLSAPVPG